jgi:hypothetical protein
VALQLVCQELRRLELHEAELRLLPDGVAKLDNALSVFIYPIPSGILQNPDPASRMDWDWLKEMG